VCENRRDGRRRVATRAACHVDVIVLAHGNSGPGEVVLPGAQQGSGLQVVHPVSSRQLPHGPLRVGFSPVRAPAGQRPVDPTSLLSYRKRNTEPSGSRTATRAAGRGVRSVLRNTAQGRRSFSVHAPPDDLVPEGGPEGEATGVVVKYGKPYGASPRTPEPPSTSPANSRPYPALLAPLHEEQPRSTDRISRIRMPRKSDHHPDEPPPDAVPASRTSTSGFANSSASEAATAPADVLRVGKVTAEGVEVAVGG